MLPGAPPAPPPLHPPPPPSRTPSIRSRNESSGDGGSSEDHRVSDGPHSPTRRSPPPPGDAADHPSDGPHSPTRRSPTPSPGGVPPAVAEFIGDHGAALVEALGGGACYDAVGALANHMFVTLPAQGPGAAAAEGGALPVSTPAPGRAPGAGPTLAALAGATGRLSMGSPVLAALSRALGVCLSAVVARAREGRAPVVALKLATAYRSPTGLAVGPRERADALARTSPLLVVPVGAPFCLRCHPLVPWLAYVAVDLAAALRLPIQVSRGRPRSLPPVGSPG